MKILFIGTGSIGRRNFESCLRLRPNAEYAALRSARRGSAPTEAWQSRIQQLGSVEEALRFAPDLIMVCNPTSVHADTVSQLAASSAAFFIEKPLAHTSVDVERIRKVITDSGRPFFYGCLLRLHPVIERTRELLKEGALGRPLSYSLHCGSYLPDWRPNRDYSTTYSAKSSMGGGVSLDLIHEFDYAEHWFGPLRELRGIKSRVSDLKIESDDLCSAISVHESGVIGQVMLSYFRPATRRDFEIIGTQGLLRGDLVSGSVEWQQKKADGSIERRLEQHSIDRDALHDRQSELIFMGLEQTKSSPWSIEDVASLTRKVIELPWI